MIPTPSTPWLILGALLALLTCFIAGAWWGYGHGEASGAAEATQTEREACKKAQTITSNTDKAHEQDDKDIRAERAAADRRVPACVPIVTRAYCGTLQRPDTEELHTAHAVASESLLDLAEDAERDRRLALRCTEFLKAERGL